MVGISHQVSHTNGNMVPPECVSHTSSNMVGMPHKIASEKSHRQFWVRHLHALMHGNVGALTLTV